ncbi:MAG: FliH/SctL family protein [Candidatus Margulisiibacteriota bacterium]
MGLIKRSQLEEKGTIVIEKVPVVPHRREIAPTPTPLVRIPTEDISRVKSEAQKIIEQAYAEAERVREEAREEGRQAGRQEAAEQIEEALATLNEAIKERKKIIKDAENEILRLALRVAEQIIRSEVSLHRDVCLNIVAEAIGRVSDREQIIVKVNREDAEYLKRYKDRLAGMLDGVKSFSIIEDSNIEPGGCVIETNLGFIDARISTKLKAIEEAFKKVSAEETKE